MKNQQQNFNNTTFLFESFVNKSVDISKIPKNVNQTKNKYYNSLYKNYPLNFVDGYLFGTPEKEDLMTGDIKMSMVFTNLSLLNSGADSEDYEGSIYFKLVKNPQQKFISVKVVDAYTGETFNKEYNFDKKTILIIENTLNKYFFQIPKNSAYFMNDELFENVNLRTYNGNIGKLFESHNTNM